MSREPLWSGLSLVGALRARVSGGLPREAFGVSIDTRTLLKGDLFFAIRGDARDGHEFARAALEKGAAAVVIDEAHADDFYGCGPLFVVRDVQQSLELLGQRARTRSRAYIAAITGSVGKTSTKEMTRLMLSHFGETHASIASYNNHWGVPLTLARMPESAAYGVFEIGMNHAGEIAALVPQVRPHVAVVTRVAAVHLENFDSVEAIAAAKAEIFSGLEAGGVAIVNADDAHTDRLIAAATPGAGHIFTFGEKGADARLLSYRAIGEAAAVEAEILGARVEYVIGAPGRHIALNSLAGLLIAAVFGINVEKAAATLATFSPPSGRGQREVVETPLGSFTLIDESYNANPTSLRAAVEQLGAVEPGPGGRRVVILGDMLELGPEGAELHASLAPDLVAARIDQLFTAGPLMSHLFYAIPETMRGAHRRSALELEDVVLEAVRPGDAVMVKGSNGSRMTRIVAALKQKYAPATAK